MSAQANVTQLLLATSRGDLAAVDHLTPLVYEELRRLARSYLSKERPNFTLQPTALVHEAYLKLADRTQLELRDRAHFFAIAARAMRQILVDHWRRRHAVKRGGGTHLPLEGFDVSSARPASLLALDDALQSLSSLDQRKARVVEMRYFGGLTTEEIASVLAVSEATVGRDLRLAQAWLHREISARNG